MISPQEDELTGRIVTSFKDSLKRTSEWGEIGERAFTPRPCLAKSNLIFKGNNGKRPHYTLLASLMK